MRVIAKSLSQPPKKQTVIDRPFLARLRTELDRVLGHLAPEFNGVKVTTGRATYSIEGTNATFKVEVAVIGQGGEVITKDAADFKAYATLLGLKPDDLGKTFTDALRGGTYKIIGARMKSRKYPILAKNTANGKVFKFPETMVQNALKKGGA